MEVTHRLREEASARLPGSLQSEGGVQVLRRQPIRAEKVTMGWTSRPRGFLSRASDSSGIIQMPSSGL